MAIWVRLVWEMDPSCWWTHLLCLLTVVWMKWAMYDIKSKVRFIFPSRCAVDLPLEVMVIDQPERPTSLTQSTGPLKYNAHVQRLLTRDFRKEILWNFSHPHCIHSTATETHPKKQLTTSHPFCPLSDTIQKAPQNILHTYSLTYPP